MPVLTRTTAAQYAAKILDWARVRAPANYANRDIWEFPGDDVIKTDYRFTHMFQEHQFGEYYIVHHVNPVLPAQPLHPYRTCKRFEKAKLGANVREYPIFERQYLFGWRNSGYHVGCYFYKMRDLENLYIITIYEPWGTLNRLLPSNNGARMDENKAKPYFYQVCLGLDFIHSHKIIHRGLRAECCFIHKGGHVRIYDLCYATSIDEPQTLEGDPRYCAPEMYQELAYTRAVDWWSFGVMLHWIFLEQYPFAGDTYETAKSSVLTEEPAGISSPHLSQRLVKFLKGLLDKLPFSRLGYKGGDEEGKDVLGDEWFKEIHPPDLVGHIYENPDFNMEQRKGTPVDENLFQNIPPEETEEDAEMYMMF